MPKRQSPDLSVAGNGDASSPELAALNTELDGLRSRYAALVTTTVGRQRFLRKAGLEYGTKRDVYKVAGYVPQGDETFDLYWSWYDRDPVAGRIVNAPARTTWKIPPEVVEPGRAERGGPTKFEDEFEELATRLRLWHYFERVDRLSRIGRYGLLFIGVPGTDQDLVNELPRLRGPQDVIYLAPYTEKEAAISSWEERPGNPRFGQPLLYEINLSSSVPTFGSKKLKVHHSRVLHVAEDLLTDEVYGRPALKRALNPLFDLLKVSASTGEGFWQLAARTLSGTLDPEMDISAADLTEFGEQLEEITHDLRRHVVGRGLDLKWLGGEPIDPSAAADLFLSLISTATNIPKRILMGSERGELSSSQDEKNWHGYVHERQEIHCEPNILRAFVSRLHGVNGLTAAGADGYEVIWSELEEASAESNAKANLDRANIAKALTPVGGEPLDLVEIDEDRNVWLLPRSAEDAATAAEETAVRVAEEMATRAAEAAARIAEAEAAPSVPEAPAVEGDDEAGSGAED